jgi:hypothetical protein
MDAVTGEIVLTIFVEPPSKMVETTVESVQFEFDRYTEVVIGGSVLTVWQLAFL